MEFVVEKGYELEESFLVDCSILCQLMKFVGSGGGLIINFDVMLLGECIFWDLVIDILIIKGMLLNLCD